MKTYYYKDANRCYWGISLVKTDEFREETISGATGEEEKSFWWRYTVKYEGKDIYKGDYLGQHDQEPALLEILTDFQSNFNASILGFAKYGAEVIDKVEVKS